MTNDIKDHIDPGLIHEFDIYDDPDFARSGHWGYQELIRKAPGDVFYTPCNGGHWVVTRYDLQKAVLQDIQHFSSRELHIPPLNSPNRMIPINLDPPEHTQYRTLLMPHFDRKSIARMEPRVRYWANHLIDQVIDDGAVDFAETFGPSFPVAIFMELMGIPFDNFRKFRELATTYVRNIPNEQRLEIEREIIDAMWSLAQGKMKEPADDLITTLVFAETRGRKLTESEIKSMMFNLFLAGLDTVANAISFAFNQLGSDPGLQDRLVREPARIADFVEEALRCFGVSSVSRYVKQEQQVGGVTFRVGDMVMCPTSSAGHDDRANPDPGNFDIDRQGRNFMTFSAGPHICIGNLLARSEIRIFTEEWLKRIPRFSIEPGIDPGFRSAPHLTMTHLPLRWNTLSSSPLPES